MNEQQHRSQSQSGWLGLSPRPLSAIIENYFKDFIKAFYDDGEGFACGIIEELEDFLRLVNKLIEISGSETKFKENMIKYYIFLKDNLD
ncbi:MAG: hypothetical protein U9O94_00650 [Nanoarchaeota archaeon]|nr:hypothetical protein [Nanoarchaeota archaeon]